MNNNSLIVFCGIDGSGKTTQAHLLVDTLHKDRRAVSYVWARWEQVLVKPFTVKWKSAIGQETGFSDGRAKENKEKKHRLLNNPFFRWLWLGAFFVDYGLQILVKVRSRLIRGGIIVSDRMFYDSVIDQAINLGNNKDWLLNNLDSTWMKIIFPKPDMVLYIDCPGEMAFERKDDAPDLEYLTDRRELYRLLADKYKWVQIDGTRSVDDIAAQVKDIVYQKLSIYKAI